MLPLVAFDFGARFRDHRIDHFELDFDAPDVFLRRQRRDGLRVGVERGGSQLTHG